MEGEPENLQWAAGMKEKLEYSGQATYADESGVVGHFVSRGWDGRGGYSVPCRRADLKGQRGR